MAAETEIAPVITAVMGPVMDPAEDEKISINCDGKKSSIDLGKSFKFQFNNVSYVCKENSGKLLKVLNDTCGEFHSGRLTAILGPSGAGKTSMLNVLSGFKATGVTGQFKLNDEERILPAFRKLSSYITQDFAIMDLLTVQETLNVSTDLKLPTDTSKADKQSIIDNILIVLNMQKVRHTLVLHLSGGERKRLSIAIELVTNPPLMFLDEPTSGLDSVASLQIIEYLRRLAADGRIIVCVVHQPSSRLMKLFDDILVMSRGEILYNGAQSEMLPWFNEGGFTCPNYYNPADFVLEVGSEQQSGNILRLIERNKEKFSKHFNGTGRPLTDEKSTMLPDKSSHTSIEMLDRMAPTIEASHDSLVSSSPLQVIRPRTQASVWRQFEVLVCRSLRSMSRNMIAVQMRLFMHIVVGILLGIVFWDIGDDGAKVLSNSSCIFFVIMFVFFGNAMPSILLCPQDTAVFIREYLNGWYSLRAYYASKIVADIPMQFACPTAFIGIVYFMTGQPHELGRFVMCWGISLLTAVTGHFIGLVFGSMFDLQMAIFLVPGITIPFLIFSGFFIRIHELSAFLRPLCDVSFFRYTMEGFMQAIYGYDRPDLSCTVDFCYFKSPEKFLKDLTMSGDRYGVDVFALLFWIVAFIILFFLSLVLRIKKTL